MYTKVATALGAFAILFSTGAWGQCDVGEIAVDYTIPATSYPSEVSWFLNDAAGNSLEISDAVTSGGWSGTWCLVPGTYTFIGIDSYGDGWCSGFPCVSDFASFTWNGVTIPFTVTANQASIELVVSNDIPGCTDAAADNYNPLATVDDGSCCLDNIITINLYDSFGDGWSWAGDFGGLVLDGVSYEFDGGSSLSIQGCFAEGCYSGEVIIPLYASEGSWEVLDAEENLVNSGTGVGELFFYAGSDACIVYGCSDANACNYNEGANVNDGSCEYDSCAGCIDPTACNYDDSATFDDGSCDYSCVGCLDPTALNYCADCTIDDPEACITCPGIQYQFTIFDSYGDGICCDWGNGSYSVSLDGEVVASGGDFGTGFVAGGVSESSSFCAEDATSCVVVTLVPDEYPGETTWELVNAVTGEVILSGNGTAGSFGTADCVPGCSDSGACNYDSAASLNDGSCDYSCVGCLDSTAANYDPNATIDSGDCVYCDPGTFIFQVDMFDSFGDGWSGAEYYLFDVNTGSQVASGSIATAFSGDGLSVGTDLICLAPGCYSFQTTTDANPGEVSMSLSDQFGNNYGIVGTDENYGVDFTLSGQCSFEGCIDPAANNFNPSATIDDGSCLLPPSNDDIENAEALTCGLSVSGTFLNANDNEGLSGTEIGNDVLGASGVWYVINSEFDQQMVASTCDTPSNDGETDYAGNTDIAIFLGDADGSLTPITSNGLGCGPTSGLASVAWNATTGSDYYIRVEGGFGHDFVISVTCDVDVTPPSNDDCGNALALTSGVTVVGTTCGADGELISIPVGAVTLYAVYYTFNTADYDSFTYVTNNISNDAIGVVYPTSGSCEGGDFGGWFGCASVTGTCGGDPLDIDTANEDIFFIVWTTDQETCGEFDITVTGYYNGCMDANANNYDPNATYDNGTCDYNGVTPSNDTCADAIDLPCNTVTVGSTGGATNAGVPLNVDGCETSPGTGVWYTFEGDGSLHTLSTCGSSIDSKINVYSATESCGGGGVDAPPADPCESLVTTNYSVGGGSWDSEISWALLNAAGDVVAQGGAPSTGNICLEAGDYTFSMVDEFEDGWNGAGATFTDGLGNVMGFATLEAGATGTATITIAPYSTEPTFIAGDFTCVAFAAVSDGNGICTLFDDDDVSLEFVSEPGLLYYVYVGAEDADGNPATDDNGMFELNFTCADIVSGCTDASACNYSPDANLDDGSCEIWSCVCASETGTPVQFYMSDTFGDGWNGAEYTVTSLAGDVIATGTLDDALFSVDANNFAGPEFGYDLFCLEPGCYNVAVSDGNWPNEVSWEVLTEDGSVLISGGPTDGITISVGGAVCGCTDPTACNYDAAATDDDGSCEDESCGGCTDSTACNFDAAALIDNGTCCYDNCLTINMNDSFGDGWNGAFYTLTSVDGTEIGTGTVEAGTSASDSYCLEPGCYNIAVTNGDWPAEVSWSVVGAFAGLVNGGAGESVTFNVGSGDQCVVGCDIACACNYNPATNITDVATCVFDGCAGCTYPSAENYDETAVTDDGSCSFDIANPCPADLNGDGSVSTADLLEFLTAFGQIC